MRRIVLYLLLFNCLLLIPSNVRAQLLPQLQDAFINYERKTLNEKLFVHTDKDSYLVGEQVWFKIYNVNGGSNAPSAISKIAYVEVLDLSNKPILQTKIALLDGFGNGTIDLPLTPLSGKYKLRAYTKFMQNLGPEVYFEKSINIFNPLGAPEKTSSSVNAIDLQFFPEGGNMVYGFTSKVGVRAINSAGKGIFVTGAIVDNQNDTVAKFQTASLGNGQLKFRPLPGRTYKAVAITTGKEVVINTINDIATKGYVIGLTRETGKLNVSLKTNISTSVCYLFSHHEKQVAVALAAEIKDGSAFFSIDEAKLPEGVSYLTVFAADGKPVCERLYFKHPTKSLQIYASADLPQYNIRQKVTVNVESKTNERQATSAHLSVAIHRLDSLQLQDQADISSYLWLSSVLKGDFESPGFYINNQTADGVLALENLLLTQGWRKFDWEEVLKGAPSMKFLPEYNGHLINGTLTTANGAPKANTSVYMGIPGKRLQFFTSKTDSAGKFIFNTKDIYGRNEIVMQTNYHIDSTAKLAVQSPFSEKYTATKYPALVLNQQQVKQLEQTNLGVQLMQRFANKTAKEFFLPEIDTTDYFMSPFKTYVLKEYTAFNTLEEVVREYVREALVSKKDSTFHITIVGKTKYLTNDPLVLVDGVPLFNFNRLFSIKPNLIEKIEVVRDRYLYGPTETEGILKFTTYKSSLQTVPIDLNAVVIDYEGVQLKRNFYSPKYETKDQKNNRIPDFRNVLYWMPNLITDEKGKNVFDFYTSDQPGTYIGIIQGITALGLPGSNTFIFQVKK